MTPIQTMFLLLLMLLSSTENTAKGDSQAQRVDGHEKNGTCVCPVNASMWMFPVVRYENVQDQVKSCEDSFNTLQDKVRLSRESLSRVQALFHNLNQSLVPYKYLKTMGVYSALQVRKLAEDVKQLETDIKSIHTAKPTHESQKLSAEVRKLRNEVSRKHNSNIINMKAIKAKLRTLKNGVNSCRTIPKDFKTSQCYRGLLSNISDPVGTKIGPYQSSYPSGSWGKEANSNSPGEKDNYWLMPLASGNAYGTFLRMYRSYKDFMADSSSSTISFASSYTHSNTIEGPSAVLYGNALYYHCYNSAHICRYDLTDTKVTRVTLPGTGVGFANKFPYCYYDCRVYSDIDVEADETGLWAIYATAGNHGNLVVSQLAWDGEKLNVTHTWETQLFKRAVSNAFMSCGVLYATRYVNVYREEVFYAFDTATGKEDNSLALPLVKVAHGVASLSYNPTDKRIYMYNDGYLLAYEAQFSHPAI